MIAPSIAIVVVAVWFVFFRETKLLWREGEESSLSGQTGQIAGDTNIIGQSDEGDTTEDIWLGEEYTSPWFADIDLVAGKRVALIDQGDNYFVRQKYCWMAEEWENRLSIFTTDEKATKQSSWYIRLMDRRSEEYRITDFHYAGDDKTRFIIDVVDEDVEPATTTEFFIYRPSPRLLQIRDEKGKVTWYTPVELQDDYSVRECVEK